MDRPDLPNPQKTSARRRLIRGAFSAPALMTVCTGSAFAQASNLRCLANAANATTAPAAWSTTGADSFLRVRLYRVRVCVNFEANGTTCKNVNDPANYQDRFYIKGSDLSSYTRGAGMPSNTQYLQISNTAFTPIGAPVPPIAAPTSIISEVYVDQYVAVRFNASGMLVGIGPNGPGDSGMVGISCWTSAFPRP